MIAAADGSALGNPGPAGWAWYVDDDCWASGGWPVGTNNMGELTGVLDLLQQTAHLDEDLVIVCDSTYAINSITKWMPNWKRRGWKKGDGKPVLNLETMKALDAAMVGRRVRFEWVKGHTGHELNEAADRLANAAAAAYRDGAEPDPGPGFAGGTRAPSVQAAPDPGPAPEADLFSMLEPSDPDTELPAEHPVIALERSLLTAEVRRRPAAVAALLHPSWQEIGQSGRIWQREEMLAEVRPLETECSLDVLNLQAVGADSVLLTWRSITQAGATLRSSLWVREGTRWRQLFHQGTPEAPR